MTKTTSLFAMTPDFTPVVRVMAMQTRLAAETSQAMMKLAMMPVQNMQAGFGALYAPMIAAAAVTPVTPAALKLVDAAPKSSSAAPTKAKTPKKTAPPKAVAKSSVPCDEKADLKPVAKTAVKPAAKAEPKPAVAAKSAPVAKPAELKPAVQPKAELAPKPAVVKKPSAAKTQTAKPNTTAAAKPAEAPKPAIAEKPAQKQAPVAAKKPAAEAKAPIVATKAPAVPAASLTVAPPKMAKPAGKPDDLTALKGVGPKLAAALNEAGIYQYGQIAKWTAANVAWVDDNIDGVRGRASRNTWVAQATELAK